MNKRRATALLATPAAALLAACGSEAVTAPATAPASPTTPAPATDTATDSPPSPDCQQAAGGLQEWLLLDRVDLEWFDIDPMAPEVQERLLEKADSWDSFADAVVTFDIGNPDAATIVADGMRADADELRLWAEDPEAHEAWVEKAENSGALSETTATPEFEATVALVVAAVEERCGPVL